MSQTVNPFCTQYLFARTWMHKSSNPAQIIKSEILSKIRLNAWLCKRSGGLMFVRHDR